MGDYFSVKYISMSGDKELIQYLNDLRDKAAKTEVYKNFNRYEKYYEGSVSPQVGFNFDESQKFGNPRDYYNVIRPIIETKATIALDVQITTSIKPTSLSHANFGYLEEINSIADILNDVWDSIKRDNQLQDLQQKIVRDGLVYGIGIAKASWDPDSDNGLGNVSLSRISPTDFFPEPSATSVDNANYIFVRRSVSKFDLVKKYRGNPKVMEVISQLDKKAPAQKDNGKETNILQSYENDKASGQAYLQEGGISSPSATTNYTIYECYIKDDTIFEPVEGDGSETEKVKAENNLRFPNGRLILYSGDHILEQGPISFPFGFPFSIFNPNNTNKLIGASEVASLMSTQDKLTTAYHKLNELMMKYKSFLLASPDSINTADLSKNFDIVNMKRGASQPPILISNKLTQDIELVRQHISDLKDDALSLARINKVMVSGERPVGTSSGAMLAQLVESPMASIRELQRNFKSFIVNLSNKGITLVQLYYTQPRILRLSGQRFAVMNQDNPIIELIDQNTNEPPQQLPQELLNDLSLNSFETEISTGSALPQSPQAIATVTMQLAKEGVFGDPSDISVREIILKSMDYPNWRSIIDKMKKSEEEQSQMPVEPRFENYLKNVSLSLGDIMDLVSALSPEVQADALYQISDSLGITVGNPDTPVPQPMQDPDMPPITEEGIKLSFN